MSRYIVKIVGNYTYRIFDDDLNVFLGDEIYSLRDANIICEWFNSIKKEG